MPPILKIATRSSRLAVAQANSIADEIRRSGFFNGEIQILTLTTRGDVTDGPLWQSGGKGLFTAELETALRAGRADLAVHSAKDLPAQTPEDLPLIAVPRRLDPRDALITRAAASLSDIQHGGVVGTSSLRRRAFVHQIRPDLKTVPLRGNVETRLDRVQNGEISAAVLAMAGLLRGGFVSERPELKITPLDVETFIPAPGQGCLAIQAAAGRDDVAQILKNVNHRESHEALDAEREILRQLGVSCHSCFAVHIRKVGRYWQGLAAAAREDGNAMIHTEHTGNSPVNLIPLIVDNLVSLGIKKLLTW
ncbi:MAG TPA: hydroxymethylbilane synthase [Phycisphaerae bacterium]|nr:hydroxymethylbilane synthase [Phycisphaerae bacterium]HPS52949.1 hydroxymethylbilane synthase [Phycisphaerae bacterium]